MAHDTNIASTARKWVAAEAERKLRKKEFGWAFVMLKKVAEECAFNDEDPFGRWQPLDGVSMELFEKHLSMMRAANKRRLDAVARARSLRGSITKMCRQPPPDDCAEIHHEYGLLCESEKDQ